MRSIGVVGAGFVGGAIIQGFSPVVKVEVYDLAADKRTVNSIEELCEKVDIIFVAVPTPMKADGSCDLKIVKSVVKALNTTKIIVIKSTIPPGSSDEVASENPGKRIVFNPEFLTERNAFEDFNNQKHLVLGGDEADIKIVADLFKKRFPEIAVLFTNRRTAETVKYITNCFLTTKVAWANEMYEICQATGVNYQDAISIATTNDPRLGTSHFMVPGSDLRRGFGGKCFCKDLNALIAKAYSVGIIPVIMETVWKRNLEIRPERDWEEIEGVISKQ